MWIRPLRAQPGSAKDTRTGNYERTLQTSAGEVNLKIPKLRRQTFETAIIERYRRRESSVEEALIEMYLAGISVRRVEDIAEVLGRARIGVIDRAINLATRPMSDPAWWGVLNRWSTPLDTLSLRICSTLYFSALETVLKVVVRLVPSASTVAMIATEIPAAIRPYSIAVAPD